MGKRTRRPRVEPGLNLSPPRAAITLSDDTVSSEFSRSSSQVSIQSLESTCVSSAGENITKAMLLVGCPRCLMYVMLSEVNPKCPKCKSTVLLDFLNDENTKKTTT
ncbi:hypothetical protein RJT34_31027 [Clitoria ternatea]|uniref:GIR1-like zinc ribbon domain-containing protein n=1 Tax=Clitoria ternatea TaxID=43366 RepID=A0AAN9I2J6_CLITE